MREMTARTTDDILLPDPAALPLNSAEFFARLAQNLTAEPIELRDFVTQSWPIIEPSNSLIESWHIDCICEHLELVISGDIRKLLINLPPREAKSNIVTVQFPSWAWTQFPALRFITCSYAASLSIKHAVMRRNIINSRWYQKNWGDTVRLAEDQNQKQEYENTARGHMIATSVGGTITGKGCDIEIEDDMVNPLEAESEAHRQHAIDMHQTVLPTRLDNPKTGSRIIVEQRTHAKDVSGHVLENEDGWVHLKLPMIAERKTTVVFPKSGREVVREVGDILNPERRGPKEVADLKKTMGSRAFVAQAQQDPTTEIGNIIKRHWWTKGFYKVLPSGFNLVITSWDMNFQETKSGSFVCGHAFGRRGADFYIFPIEVRERMDFAETVPAVLGLKGQVPSARAHLVERKANGAAIISHLHKVIPGLIPVEPKGSKVARAQACAPYIEAGNVHLPDPSICPWTLDYIEECAKFRGDDNEINDRVDVLSQALNWFAQIRVVDQQEEEVVGTFIDINGEGASLGGFSD